MTPANYTEMMQTDAKTAAQALANDPAFVRELVQQALNTALEAAMTELLGAGEVGTHGSPSRLSFGVLHAVAVDEDGDRGVEGAAGSRRSVQHRGLRAVSAVGEGLGVDAGGDVREGVSTRKVGAMAERLCGHEFSATTISNMVAGLDRSLKARAARPLQETIVRRQKI